MNWKIIVPGLLLIFSCVIYWIQQDDNLSPDLIDFIGQADQVDTSPGYYFAIGMDAPMEVSPVDWGEYKDNVSKQYEDETFINVDPLWFAKNSDYCKTYDNECLYAVISGSDVQENSIINPTINSRVKRLNKFNTFLSSSNMDLEYAVSFDAFSHSFKNRQYELIAAVKKGDIELAINIWEQDISLLRKIALRTNSILLKFVSLSLLSDYISIANYMSANRVVESWSEIKRFTDIEVDSRLWWDQEISMYLNTVTSTDEDFQSDAKARPFKKLYYNIIFKPNIIKNNIFKKMQFQKEFLFLESSHLEAKVPKYTDEDRYPIKYMSGQFFGKVHERALDGSAFYMYHLRLHNYRAKIRLFNIAQSMRKSGKTKPSEVKSKTNIANPFMPSEDVKYDIESGYLFFEGPGADHRNLRKLQFIFD